jgi:uracil-DNA glycosylase
MRRAPARLPLLVGEAPGRLTEGKPPFSGRSGARLEGLLGVGPGELSSHFRVRNLLELWPGYDGKGAAFPFDMAVVKAGWMVEAGELLESGVIFAGARVERAFLLACESGYTDAARKGRIPKRALLRWYPPQRFFVHVRSATIPHPSGINTWWNEPRNVARVRRFLREAAGLS